MGHPSTAVISPSTTRSPRSRISHDIVAGAFSGLVARFFTAPFDLIKIRFQLQTQQNMKYTSMSQAFATMVKEEGLFSLWKGNLSATILWISYAMVQFSVYGVLKTIGEKSLLGIDRILNNNINNNPNDSKNIQTKANNINSNHNANNKLEPNLLSNNKILKAFVLFLAGAGAGIASTIATYPFDIMRTQFALQGQQKVYSSMQSFLSQTLQTKGIQGFYAGLTPAVIGIAPYMGLNFALYETFKTLSTIPLLKSDNIQSSNVNSTETKQPLSLLSKGLCGGLAGGTSKFIVYPLDTIKKRLQSQMLINTMSSPSIGTVVKYKGVTDCMRTIYINEGIKGFYRGIIPTTVKSVVATAITFAAFDFAKEALAHIPNNHDNSNVNNNNNRTN
eukprot:gene5925-8172_t